MSALSSTKLCVCWAGAALVVVALGCGGSTDSPGAGGSAGKGGSDPSGGSGGSGGTGGSTTGGTGGTGGTSGTGGSGGVSDAGEVVCNGVVCAPPMVGGATACCTAQNTCGVSFSIGGQPGTCFDPAFDAGPRFDVARPEAGPGVPDPNCASLTIGGGFTLGGCCMPDNTCGFSSQISGCVSLETLRMLGIPGVNLPDGGPMACVFPPPIP